MVTPYNERVCKYYSFNKGNVFTVKFAVGTRPIDLEYIDCQRDNKGAQEDFIRTKSDKSLSVWLEQTKFQHCLYSREGMM